MFGALGPHPARLDLSETLTHRPLIAFSFLFRPTRKEAFSTFLFFSLLLYPHFCLFFFPTTLPFYPAYPAVGRFCFVCLLKHNIFLFSLWRCDALWRMVFLALASVSRAQLKLFAVFPSQYRPALAGQMGAVPIFRWGALQSSPLNKVTLWALPSMQVPFDEAIATQSLSLQSRYPSLPKFGALNLSILSFRGEA